MKKYLSTLFFVCLMALIMPSVTSANVEPILKVRAFSITFKDSVYIKYAVSAENASDVKLLIWTEEQDSYEYGTQKAILDSEGTTTVSGVSCKVFTFTGLTAKQMTDNVYARVYTIKNGTTYYSDVVRYSILDYAYSKLGRTGTATNDTKLLNLINAMLEYGAAAQKYYNGGKGYRLDRLATDTFYQVKVVGGIIGSGGDKQLFKAGERVTITAPSKNDSGEIFDHWKNSAGENVGNEAVHTITVSSKNEVFTAVYIEDTVQNTHTVVFKDYDGTVLSTQTVEDGSDAIPPENPSRNGYKFTGWSRTYTKVSEDITVTAGYTAITAPTIQVGNVKANAASGTVSVDISVLNNPGIASLILNVSYANNLTLQSITYNTAYGAYVTAPTPYTNPQIISYMQPISQVDVDGVFATLTFSVSGAVSGDKASIQISYDQDNTFDEEFDEVVFELINGGIVFQ